MKQPIRILHIVTYMGRGGLETMLMNYYRHMDRDKVQFDFLVHRDFEADYDKEILSLGGRIFHVSRLVPWSKSYRSKLRSFFTEHPEYRVVHVHQDCLSSVALQCAKECGVPVRIAHCHSSSQDKNFKYLIKLHYKKQIAKYATQLFACGNDAGKWMFGGAPFQIIKNAINTSEYVYQPDRMSSVRKEFGIPQNAVVIGHVGRFSAVKNQTFLLNIFDEIHRRKPDSYLLFVGDGVMREEIEQRVQKLGLEKQVVFTGVRSDVADLMQAMDIFVFPSLYEGLPVTMVEAQAAELPCVISNMVPDDCIVTHGLATKMDLSASPAAWANHILSQIGQPRIDHSAEIIAAGYDIAEAAKQLEQYYLEKYEV